MAFWARTRQSGGEAAAVVDADCGVRVRVSMRVPALLRAARPLAVPCDHFLIVRTGVIDQPLMAAIATTTCASSAC